MAKLTQTEQRLLRHRPTPTTWICTKTRVHDGEKIQCQQVNAGKYEKCWLCCAKRPTRPLLLWPRYVAACKKAGIEPGTRWPPKTTTEAASGKTTRRKGNR